MNYTYFNSSPDYFPVKFNSRSYEQSLCTLLDSKGTLAVSKHCFKRLSNFEKISNAISWLFGFKDRTNSTKINGEILKFAYYGVANDILTPNLRNQFKALAIQSYIAPEVKTALNLLNDENILTDQKISALQGHLITYFSNHASKLRPHFWKRHFSSPRVPEKFEFFGETHLLKATLLTGPNKSLKSLDHIAWAINLGSKDLNFQKKCYDQLQALVQHSPSIRYEAWTLIPFISKLSKHCISQNDYKTAEHYLTESIDLFGQDERLDKPLKEIYFKMKRWEKLKDSVFQFTKKFSKNEKNGNTSNIELAEQARGIAKIYELREDHHNVIDYLTKVVEYDPSDSSIKKEIASAYQLLAKCYIQSNPDQALVLLQKALYYSPEDPSLPTAIASLYVHKGNKIVNENLSLLTKASHFFKLKEPSSPITYYEQAYIHCPTFIGPHIQWLITHYEENKNFPRALELYRAVSALNPNLKLSLKSCYEQALVKNEMKDAEGAYELLLLALKFDPSNNKIAKELIYTGFHLAKSYQKCAFDKALEHYNKLLPLVKEVSRQVQEDLYAPNFEISEQEISSNISDIYYDLALCDLESCLHPSIITIDYQSFAAHIKNNQIHIDKVVELFQKALLANPKSAKAHFELANFAEYFGVEKINANKHFQQAVELNPKNYFYKLRLAETDLLRGNTQEKSKLREQVTKGFFSNTINYPDNSAFDYLHWFDERYLINKERFYKINAHQMCRK